MNAKIAEIKRIAAQLAALYPGCSMTLMVTQWNTVQFSYHGSKTYGEATDFFRELGIQQREKRVYPTYTAVEGETDGVTVITYPDELPPTCKKVIKIERVPKTKVVETGEFYEVAREVIECGNETEDEPQPQTV